MGRIQVSLLNGERVLVSIEGPQDSGSVKRYLISGYGVRELAENAVSDENMEKNSFPLIDMNIGDVTGGVEEDSVHEWSANVDSEGVIDLPDSFLDKMKNHPICTLTKGLNKSLLLWKESPEEIRQAVDKIKLGRMARSKVKSFYAGDAEQAVLDYRFISIPKHFRDHSEMGSEAVIVQRDYGTEIWAKEVYESFLQDKELVERHLRITAMFAGKEEDGTTEQEEDTAPDAYDPGIQSQLYRIESVLRSAEQSMPEDGRNYRSKMMVKMAVEMIRSLQNNV